MLDCRKCKKMITYHHVENISQLSILSSVVLLVKLRKEEILQELGYLNGGVLTLYKVS